MEDFNFDFFCKGCNKSREYREANCITRAVVRRYKKGEQIVYKGDRATSILMVSEGRISNRTILESGISLIAIEHNAPYPLGAVALFAPENHFRIDSVAIEECTVGVISRDRIEKQIAECKIFMRNFIADNATKVDILSSHLSLLSCKNIKAKIAFYILTRTHNNAFRFDRSISELAIYFCVERPSLSRALGQMTDEGLISYERGSGTILNLNALKELI